MYNDFRNWILSFPCYGYTKQLSGIEEQAFTEFFLTRNGQWHHIHQKYQAIPWKPNWIHPFQIEECPILHFIHEPPFLQREKWEDTKIWWKNDVFSKE